MSEWISVKDRYPPIMTAIKVRAMYGDWPEAKEYSHEAIYIPLSGGFFDLEELTPLDFISEWRLP